jgi:LSD1 subclass zinc finger protein
MLKKLTPKDSASPVKEVSPASPTKEPSPAPHEAQPKMVKFPKAAPKQETKAEPKSDEPDLSSIDGVNTMKKKTVNAVLMAGPAPKKHVSLVVDEEPVETIARVKEGLLTWRTEKDKGWNQRYFVFDGRMLAVFKDAKARASGKEKERERLIDLNDANAELAAVNEKTKQSGFSLFTSAQERLMFVAEDRGIARNWVEAFDPTWAKRVSSGRTEFKDNFVQASLDLDDMPNNNAKIDAALAIYNEYFDPGSPSEIPELSKHRAKVLADLRRGEFASFAAASAEFRSMYMAYALMRSSPVGTCSNCQAQLQYTAKGGKVRCYKCQAITQFPPWKNLA